MYMFPLAASQSELIEDALVLMLVGMGVVFMGLVVLMFVSNAIRAMCAEKKAPAPAAATQATGPTSTGHSPVSATDNSFDPQLIAVLTAAATAALRRPVRVLSARNYLVKQDPGHIWSQSGRRSIMTSHRPKHR